MDEIKLSAYGKVNIGLDVTGRTDSGYHTVDMIMQTVSLRDIVTVRRGTSSGGIELSVNHPGVPDDERNIAWKAAARIMEGYALSEPVSIDIDKGIPVEAGMAGGSTDGAAVIMAMNELFSLNMTEAEADDIAVSLGADVPFCLRRGTYRARGIGEKLTELTAIPKAHLIIVNPPFGISTKLAYERVDGVETPAHPDIDAIVKGIEEGSIEAVCRSMGNILYEAVKGDYPVLEEIICRLSALGALRAMMTGSGPTVFGVFADEEKRENAFAEIIREDLGKCYRAEFVF